jgi:copper transport protein
MGPSASKRIFATLFILLIALVLVVAVTPQASAHAQVQRSEPADLSQLTTAPKVLRFFFTEPIKLADTSIEVIDSAGHTVQNVSAVTVEARGVVNAQPTVALVKLPELPQGIYQATWRTVAQDAHVSRGTIVFGVGAVRVAAAQDRGQPVDRKEAAFRFLAVLGLAGVFGGSFVLNRDSLSRTGRAAVAMGAIVVTFAVVFLANRNVLRARMIQPGVIAIVFVLLAFLARLVPRNRAVASNALSKRKTIAIGLIGIMGLLGTLYAATLHLVGTLINWVFVVQLLHVVSAIFWSGGCVVLSVGWFRARKSASERAELRTVLTAFAWPSIIALIVALTTGLLLTTRAVVSVDALLLSSYGRVLLVKIALVSVALYFGLRNAAALGHGNAIRNLRRFGSGPGRLRSSLFMESVALIGVLAAAVLLSVSPLAVGSRWSAKKLVTSAQPTISADLADLVTTLTIKPNRPGSNFIDVGVFDTRLPVPSVERDVHIRLTRKGDKSATKLLAVPDVGDGYYRLIDDQFGGSGTWDVRIDVDRPGLPSQTITLPWTVPDGVGSAVRSTRVSKAQLKWPLTAVSALFLVGSLVLVSRDRRKHRRRIDQPQVS